MNDLQKQVIEEEEAKKVEEKSWGGELIRRRLRRELTPH
jgi:hypothetical protein